MNPNHQLLLKLLKASSYLSVYMQLEKCDLGSTRFFTVHFDQSSFILLYPSNSALRVFNTSPLSDPPSFSRLCEVWKHMTSQAGFVKEIQLTGFAQVFERLVYSVSSDLTLVNLLLCTKDKSFKEQFAG